MKSTPLDCEKTLAWKGQGAHSRNSYNIWWQQVHCHLHICALNAQDSSGVASPGSTSDGGIRHAHESPQESPVPTPVGFHDIHPQAK